MIDLWLSWCWPFYLCRRTQVDSLNRIGSLSSLILLDLLINLSVCFNLGFSFWLVHWNWFSYLFLHLGLDYRRANLFNLFLWALQNLWCFTYFLNLRNGLFISWGHYWLYGRFLLFHFHLCAFLHRNIGSYLLFRITTLIRIIYFSWLWSFLLNLYFLRLYFLIVWYLSLFTCIWFCW